MSIQPFWPLNDQSHAHSCLFTEAETAADAVFLAVHQSMALYRESIGGNQSGVSKTEHDLLTAFLRKNPASGTLIVPIVGNSGVGKSHMIRWLDAHLRLRRDADESHIVRIPKSSSLKRVLELVLDGLPDDKFGEIKKQMLSAKLPPTRLQATLGLQAGLLYELEIIGKAAKERIVEGSDQSGDKARKAHCSSRGLLALLKDPEIHSHFVAHEGDDVEKWGVLTRIADRCLNGSLKNDKGELNQFLESDFDFLQGSSLDTANLARDTRGYVSRLRAQPEMLQQAINCLKEARESAVASLVTFQGSLSLSDLFVGIRESLYQEGKELILLVEDFAVLAGVQGALLDAIVREAIRDGKQELCTMRTAIAVTQGQLPETVMTRAQYLWKVDDKPFSSEPEALSVYENFVGSYLNAARFGEPALEKAYNTRKNLTSWIPRFEDTQDGKLDEGDQRALESFGFSPNGYSLFPLNQGAIRQIARKHFYSAQDDIYKFDPRKLINKVLRETVIDNRDLYLDGLFPPKNFSEYRKGLQADAVTVVSEEFPLDTQPRISALLYFWGDDPKSREEVLRLPRKVYTAFGLPELKTASQRLLAPEKVKDKGGSRSGRPEVKPPEPVVTVDGTPPPASWDDRLRNWREGQSLNQTSANAIRRAIAEAVGVWLDSSSMFIHKVVLDQTKVYLPATGQGLQSSEGAVMVACEDADFEDEKGSARFMQIVRAIMRYEECRNWDYDGGDSDSILYASFISSMAEQARDWCISNGVGVPRSALNYIAQALLIGGALLNIPGGSKKDSLEENLVAILSLENANSNQFQEATTQWDKLKESAASARVELREQLMILIGARQGMGGELAIDASALLEAVDDLRGRAWSLPDDLDLTLFGNFTAPVKQYVQKIRQKDLERVINSTVAEKKKWLELVEGAIGADFERENIKTIFLSAIEASKKAAVFHWRGGEARGLVKRTKDLGPIKETYNLTSLAVDDASDLGVKLAALSKIDDVTMLELHDYLCDYRAFLDESFDVAKTQLDGVSESPRDVANSLDKDFDKMVNIWTSIAGRKTVAAEERFVGHDDAANNIEDKAALSLTGAHTTEGAISITRSEQLIVMSERIEHLNSERQVIDILMTVTNVLSEGIDKCNGLKGKLEILVGASVSEGVLVDKDELKSLLDKIKNLRGRLEKNPETLTHRNTWGQCQNSVNKLKNSLETQLLNQWENFVSGESPSTGQTSIFGGLPAHRAEYQELLKLSEQLDVIRQRLPEDAGVVETVREYGVRMRELVAGMSLDGEPDEKVNFLKRCQQNGVPLTELDSETQKWLNEKGFAQDLVIRVK